MIASADAPVPSHVAMRKGNVENDISPLTAYFASFQNDHVVSPESLSSGTYANGLVLKPIQENRPFEKR